MNIPLQASATPYLSTANLARWAALAGIYLLAFFCFLSPPAVALGEVLLLLSALLDWRRSRAALGTFYGKIFLAFIVYALLSAAWASAAFGYTSSQFEQAGDYIQMSLFWLAGWAIYRYDIRPAHLFAVCVAGMLLSLALHFPYARLDALLAAQERLRIGSIHPIQLGTYLAVLSVGLVVALAHLLSPVGRVPFRWVLVGLVVAILALFLVGLMLTWSRGAWLAWLVGVAFVGVFKLVKMVRGGRLSLRNLAIMGGVATVCVLLLAGLGAHKITQRITAESDIYERILSGDIKDLPKTSVGWRVHMQIFAWQKFRERPWFGWGPYTKQLIDNSDLNLHLGHLHNSYWEVLLRFGVVGSALIVAGIGWLIRGLWLAYGRDAAEEPVMLGVYGGLVALAVWAMIDYKFTGWENTALLWLLAGTAASRAFRVALEPAPGVTRA